MANINQKFKNTYKKTKKQKNEYIKNLKVSSLFGLFFGIVYVIVTYITNDNLDTTIYFVPIICAVISGFAGLLATFLENFLINKGLDNAIIRKTVIFSVVITLTITITIIVFTQSDFSSFFQNMQRNMIWGIFFGVLFAVVITAVEYYNWKVEQKMKILELENKYLEDLSAKDTMLKEATKNLLVSKERNRMARELHDSISQDIHGISYGLTSLKNQVNKLKIEDEKIHKIISHLEKTAENTSEELKYMIKELKPAALEKNSLKEALVTHCELFSARQSIVVKTDLEDIEKLTPEQEYSIYRIVQEACTNIQKHSEADLVNITLIKDKNSNKKVYLTIKDNGKGFNINQIKRGNGLNNMELRTKQVGGNFEIKSQKQKGTTIKAEFLIY